MIYGLQGTNISDSRTVQDDRARLVKDYAIEAANGALDRLSGLPRGTENSRAVSGPMLRKITEAHRGLSDVGINRVENAMTIALDSARSLFDDTRTRESVEAGTNLEYKTVTGGHLIRMIAADNAHTTHVSDADSTYIRVTAESHPDRPLIVYDEVGARFDAVRTGVNAEKAALRSKTRMENASLYGGAARYEGLSPVEQTEASGEACAWLRSARQPGQLCWASDCLGRAAKTGHIRHHSGARKKIKAKPGVWRSFWGCAYNAARPHQRRERPVCFAESRASCGVQGR